MTAPHPRVSIVLSDRSWILERLGRELQARLPAIELADAASPRADINYYITFACRKEPAPTLEMALFTHMEQAPELQALFYSTAREVHLPVTMSTLYRDMLHEAGIRTAITIPPGVDRERFDARLRIGVVGRAYHTGRKGEGLVTRLMDMPGIDWHFTGSGWPLPGRHVPDDELPDFYRSMDYILVPALYEGGPMCVPEALAVGTPVIASDVGWVREFPHIPFRTGDAEDLRRVLTELLEVKRNLRASTERYTWDAFAEGHERAFRGLMEKAGKAPRRAARKPAKAADFTGSVRLLLHGNEASTLGGPSVRVPKTAAALRAQGLDASSGSFVHGEVIREDLVHLFNVWNPHTALAALRSLKAAGKRVVFSPIFLDLGERDFWHQTLPQMLAQAPGEVPQAYAEARACLAGRGRLSEAMPGYNAMVREMIALADHVILLSSAERAALERIGAPIEPERMSIVRNPVDLAAWQGGDPALFRRHHLDPLPGPQDYVLCLGRIEPRKNQLMLARVLRDLPLRLVLIGHVGDAAYAEKIRAQGGPHLLMPGRLENGSEMLRSAMAGARVFALPSWCEGASLAVLEAAASGANLVLSDRSSEREYFGDLAQYCDPGSEASLRAAIEAALHAPDPAGRAAALRALVGANNSWERYTRDTARAYAAAARAAPRPAPPAQFEALRATPQLVLDITTLAHHQGRITGISRVEAELAQALTSAEAPVERPVRFICWNDSIARFVEVPARFARLGQALRFRSQFDERMDTPPAQLSPDCTVIVAGSAWMQNRAYVRGLEELKVTSGCSLTAMIHDLVPFKFPMWFDKGYAPVFRENFHRLADLSDQILTVSRSCLEDVTRVSQAAGKPLPPMRVIRNGDPLLEGRPLSPSAAPQALLAGKSFVLAVGAIHIRKNYDMLYRVWARLADEGKLRDLHLVIVGGVAWNGSALAETIAADPRVNSRIHILSDIGDADLAWLYAGCLFTVFPSHYEGWGLPVAESLVQGKLCLATSSSSVPEIAPDLVEHIDPEDFAAWHGKICFYAGSRAAREAREEMIRARYRPVAWSETAREIVAAVSGERRVRGLKAACPGEVIFARQQAGALEMGFTGAWHKPEKWGRWSAGDRAGIVLNTARALRAGSRPLHVLLRLRAHGPGEALVPLEIGTARGLSLFQAHVTYDSLPREVILTVPASEVDAEGLLRLVLSLPPRAEPPNPKTPPRMLGLGLEHVVLLDADFSNPLQSLGQPELWIDGATPTLIDFSNPEHRSACGNGCEAGNDLGLGSWLGGHDILLPLLPGAGMQEIILTGRPLARPEAPVTVSLSCGGQVLARARLESDQPEELRLRLDADALGLSFPVVLRVETDRLQTAQDIGISSASTISGFGTFSLALCPAPAPVEEEARP